MHSKLLINGRDNSVGNGVHGWQANAGDILTCAWLSVCGFVEWQLASHDRATANRDFLRIQHLVWLLQMWS